MNPMTGPPDLVPASAGLRRRVLLAGKHELAAALWSCLREDPLLELAAITCAGEDPAGPRPGLSGALRSAGIAPRNPLESGGRPRFDRSALSEAVNGFRPELLLSAGYDRIIREDVLRAVPWCLNVHFGALPRYRGSYSIPHAILADEPFIGVTLHEVDPGIDSGPIVDQQPVENRLEWGAGDIYRRCVEVGVEMVTRWLAAWRAGRARRGTPQDETRATYFPLRFEFTLDWHQLAHHVRNQVRAAHFPPLPGARAVLGGEVIEVLHPVEIRHHRPAGRPGSVVRVDGRWGVGVLNGTVLPGRIRIARADRPVDFDEWAERLVPTPPAAAGNAR